VKYGGNTACVEVVIDNDYSIVFDAGTGIRELGKHYLVKNAIKNDKGDTIGMKPVKMGLFVTHTHWDHIQGWPFFVPGFMASSDIKIVGAAKVDARLEDVLKGQQQHQYFPVALGEMKSKPQFWEIEEDQPIYVIGQKEDNGALSPWYIFDPKLYNEFIPNKVFEVKVSGRKLNHPHPGVFAYRLECDGKVVVMATDTEHHGVIDPKLAGLAKNADVLIYDCQYSNEQYAKGTTVGWGHSTPDEGVKLAQAAGVKTMVMFHHDPNSTDDMIDAMAADVLVQGKEVGVDVVAAYEGLEIEV
jgi:phosphoribosyl 1,2-cyclic phosphodiesterase